MIEQIVYPTTLSELVNLYDKHNEFPMEDIEATFYEKALTKSVEQGHAYKLNDVEIYLIERDKGYQIFYSTLVDSPDDGLKLLAYIATNYEDITYRPLGMYFFGLIFSMNQVSLAKYVRGGDYQVHFKFYPAVAEEYMRYCNGV